MFCVYYYIIIDLIQTLNDNNNDLISLHTIIELLYLSNRSVFTCLISNTYNIIDKYIFIIIIEIILM